MKISFIAMILGIVLASCSVKKETVQIEAQRMNVDSVEYELIISEPGYESWAATNRRPDWYHSMAYYKNFNQLYVNEWNSRVRTMGYAGPYDFLIDYDYRVSYGMELEHELFWYFKFMQQKYNIKLLNTERP